MSGYVVEWLNLLGRWVHIITGIAWIGASFYFVWLDNHLHAPKSEKDRDKGVAGELWAVHGGGFYNAQKYQVAPEKLPETLHWFKWEAYSTWLSGMFLLILMYWYSAELYLIDPAVMELGKPVAIAIGMATLVIGWFGYDALCRARWAADDRLLAAVIFVLSSLAAFLLCQVFSGRGAFIHYGAMLGTIMVANVYFVIIPGQKDLVKAKIDGRDPDPIHGIRGKQRSVHNTYFTLPVLFVMISNHHAMTYAHRFNWLILIAISLAGALVRVYFVARHRGKASPLPLILGFLLIAIVAAALVPASSSAPAVSAQVPGGNSPAAADAADPAASETVAANHSADKVDEGSLQDNVVALINQRCAGCHADKPTYPGFYSPPMGIVLKTVDDLQKHADGIYQQSVVTRAMPIGNLTGITDDERLLIGDWYEKYR